MDTIKQAFLRSVSFLLALSAFAKFWSAAFGAGSILKASDPLVGIPFGPLLLTVALVEVLVASVCLSRSSINGLMAVAWLSTVFLAYRIGLWWIDWKKPCSCLGNLTDALHISPQLADNVMKGVLAFMLIGSISLLIAHHRQGRPLDSSALRPVPEPEKA